MYEDIDAEMHNWLKCRLKPSGFFHKHFDSMYSIF